MAIKGGGVSRNVIKSIIKVKKTDKTQETDNGLYERAFHCAVNTHKSEVFSFKGALTGLPVNKLKEIMEYLKHDKSTKDKKIIKLIEFTKEYQDLEHVQSKLTVAMDTLRSLSITDLENNYGNGYGEIVLERFKEGVVSAIAVKESRGADMNVDA
jgi:hypothetical protein